MKNYNTGIGLSYDEFIHDKKEAAKQFAEGDHSLEKLLNFCFDNNIITKACCKGHIHTDASLGLPYLNFAVCEENDIYLQALLYYFKDKHYEIYFDNHSISFHEDIFSLNKENSSLFKDILNVFRSINLETNYFHKLPTDLKCLYSLSKKIQNNYESEEYLFYSYYKKENYYIYLFYTNDSNFIQCFEICDIPLNDEGLAYQLKSKNREDVEHKLLNLNSQLTEITQKKYVKKHSF